MMQNGLFVIPRSTYDNIRCHYTLYSFAAAIKYWYLWYCWAQINLVSVFMALAIQFLGTALHPFTCWNAQAHPKIHAIEIQLHWSRPYHTYPLLKLDSLSSQLCHRYLWSYSMQSLIVASKNFSNFQAIMITDCFWWFLNRYLKSLHSFNWFFDLAWI